MHKDTLVFLAMLLAVGLLLACATNFTRQGLTPTPLARSQPEQFAPLVPVGDNLYGWSLGNGIWCFTSGRDFNNLACIDHVPTPRTAGE